MYEKVYQVIKNQTQKEIVEITILKCSNITSMKIGFGDKLYFNVLEINHNK